MSDSIFGQLFDADLLESAVRDKLKLWMETYLREIEIQRGLQLGDLVRPKAWLVSEEIDKEWGDKVPAVVVVSPGLAAPPVAEGDGSYASLWRIAVGAVVSAGGPNSRDGSRRLLRRYVGLLRDLMLQNKNYGYVDEDTELFEVRRVAWMDESFDKLNFEDTQTLGIGESVFEVEIGNTVNPRLGPAKPVVPDPDTMPGSEWPTVAEALQSVTTVREVT